MANFTNSAGFVQCCGSGSVSGLDPDSMRFLDPDPNPKGQKNWHTKIEKNLINLIFWSARCSVLRAEGFSCSFDALYAGLGISKLQFLIKKDTTTFQLYFFLPFLVIKPWIRIRSGFTWNAGSGSVSGYNESASTTLVLWVWFCKNRHPGPIDLHIFF